MHVPDEEISPKRVDISYVIIGLCLFSIYLLAGRELSTVDQTIVPRGDAFSYSTFLFEILNRSRESFGSALQYVVELRKFYLAATLSRVGVRSVFGQSTRLAHIHQLFCLLRGHYHRV